MQRIAIINGYTSDRASALLVDESWKNFTSRMKKIKKPRPEQIFPQLSYKEFHQKFLRLLLYENNEITPYGAGVRAEVSVRDLQKKLIKHLAKKERIEWKKIIF